jgi:nucleoside-diphosphate-sugar epimerase
MILLVGATGFIGSHILDALVAEAQKEILVTTRLNSSLRNIEHIAAGKFQKFVLDGQNIDRLFKKYSIDTIINAAVSYGRNEDSSVEVLNSNLIFPVRLIEEGIKNGLKCFINTDSYFNKNNLSYSHLLNYAVSKKSLQAWLRYFSKDIKIINLILEHVYGPRDSVEKFVAGLVQEIAFSRSCSVKMTHGHQLRDFIYVKDVAESYLKVISLASEQDFGFREYEIGTGRCTQIRELALKIKEISNSSTVLDFGAIPYRRDEIMSSYADIREICNIGWTPRYDVEQGLREMLDEGVSHLKIK